MKKVVIASATVVGKSQPLDANELAHACGAEVEWVARLVEVGIVSAPATAGKNGGFIAWICGAPARPAGWNVISTPGWMPWR